MLHQRHRPCIGASRRFDRDRVDGDRVSPEQHRLHIETPTDRENAGGPSEDLAVDVVLAYAWRCDVRRSGPFGSSLFLEYEPVVVQELALEADLVGAHARGEREPEIRAGQPTREKPKLQ